jgi:hypothetical protein
MAVQTDAHTSKCDRFMESYRPLLQALTMVFLRVATHIATTPLPNRLCPRTPPHGLAQNTTDAGIPLVRSPPRGPSLC